MAHFAQLDDNNKVLQVIVVNNEELLDNGIESEAKGIAFCQSLLGENTRWVQTSYNGKFRKNFAGIGFTYDPIEDHFYSPSLYPSWTLGSDARWGPPVPMPVNPYTPDQQEYWLEPKYQWDENTCQWIEITDTIQTTQPDEADLTEGQN